MMSDKDNEKHVFSYMDGIPVKISEKYKPPRRVILPVGFQNRLLQPPVSANYDFELEEQILNKLQQWREIRLKEKQNRKERIDAVDAKLKAVENKDPISCEDNVNPANGSTPPPPSVSSAAPGVKTQPEEPSVCATESRESNPILRPIPIKHHVVTSKINNNKPISAFNLSDFEADTSSPFDNVELKTINDLEELAQVLQPSVIAQPSGYYESTMSSGQYAAMHHIVNQNQSFNPTSHLKMLSDSKSLLNCQSHLNGITSNYSVYNNMAPSALQMMDSYQLNVPANSYHPQSVIVPTSSCDQSVSYNFVDREQVSQGTRIPFDYNCQEPQRKMQSVYSSNMWSSGGPFSGNDGLRSFTLNPPGELSSSSNHLPSRSPPSSPVRSGDRSPSSESAAGAVAQELSQLLKLKSYKPSPKTNNQYLQEEKSVNQEPVMELLDPFMSLQLEDQLLVQKITEMGFPRARVARTCKALGGNDKKVVESLLSLQSLLDAGYPEDRAEHALLLNNYDVSAASRFLQAEAQLLDLGFSVERVAEALLKFSCDRDKALDFLLS